MICIRAGREDHGVTHGRITVGYFDDCVEENYAGLISTNTDGEHEWCLSVGVLGAEQLF